MFCAPIVGAQTQSETGSTAFAGKIGDVTRPDSIWIEDTEIRLRSPFVIEANHAEALEFMKALAHVGREVECQLTGERTPQQAGGLLVGDCSVFGPTDGREIDLGSRLIERGFARLCQEPDAMIAIYPPVFVCE